MVLFDRLRQPQVLVHRHVVRGAFGTVGGYLSSAVFFVLLVYCWSRIDLRKERDVKYRFLEAAGMNEVNPYLHYADSFCRSDPAQFGKMTEVLEELHERRERLGLVNKQAEVGLRELRKLRMMQSADRYPI